jgi:methyl-accepting chemotaxis protein
MITVRTLAGTVMLTSAAGALYWLHYQENILLASLAAANAGIAAILLYTHNKFLRRIFAGENRMYSTEKKIEEHVNTLRHFKKNMLHAVEAVRNTGSDAFGAAFNRITDPSVRAAVAEAHERFVSLRKKESNSLWIASGISTISELKHTGKDVSEYAQSVIQSIVPSLSATHGGFFILGDRHADPHFRLIASYAHGRRKCGDARINPGDGILGQLYYEPELKLVTNVPEHYLKITSGLGEATARCICIVPLMWERELFGAIEIATFKPFDSCQLEYLQKIGEIIGYNLSTIEAHQRTEALLRETQDMTVEIKAREEELRQNMMELRTTQDEMRQKQKEMNAVMSSLSTVELDLEGNVVDANQIFLGITGYALADITRRSYKNLIPQDGNDPVQYEIMWNSILSGRAFSGEFRIVNKAGVNMWMAGNFTPVTNEQGAPLKVMVVSLFITQDKEKLLELQEIVAAMKSCFPIAELNPDLTFRSANELFLNEIGVKRLELKHTSPSEVLCSDSLSRVQQSLNSPGENPDSLEVNIVNRKGYIRRFDSSLVRLMNSGENRKKGLLILRNAIKS